MFIGRELKKKAGWLDAKAMCEKCSAIFERMDIQLDPRTMVRELDASISRSWRSPGRF